MSENTDGDRDMRIVKRRLLAIEKIVVIVDEMRSGSKAPVPSADSKPLMSIAQNGQGSRDPVLNRTETNSTREYPEIKKNSLTGQIFYLLVDRNANSQETAVGLRDVYAHLSDFRGGGVHGGGSEDKLISRLRSFLASSAEVPYTLESYKTKPGAERVYWLKKK